MVRLARVGAALLVAAAVAFLLTWRALSHIILGFDFFDLHSNFGYVRILPEFMLGIALYRLGTERRISLLEGRWAVPLLFSTIAILAPLRWEILLVLMMSVLILAVAETARQGRIDLLTQAGMIYLGEISYSIYMVHVPVATALLRGAILALGSAPIWIIPPATLATIGVAAVSHRLIEVPSRRKITLSPLLSA